MLALFVSSVLAASPDVLERHECFRCHSYPSKLKRDEHVMCGACHQRISHASPTDAQQVKHWGAENWARYVRRTQAHFVDVPPLVGLSRLRASWLVRFLAQPFDLRPELEEQMIRNRLTEAERLEVAKRLGAEADQPSPPPPDAQRLAKGAERFAALGCPGCHTFIERAKVLTPPSRAQKLAPSLRHARERMNHATIARYLVNPRALNPASEMPVAMAAEDAALLADFIVFAPLPAEGASSAPALPAYDAAAPVPTYEEVEERVFKRVCWHCHSNPDYANGNGGPGMSGGFGYPGRGLSFSTFEEVMTGSRDDRGERQSVFRKGETGEPVLLEVLRARTLEVAGRPPARVGMPLGLPALAPEDFALVERWVKGGRPAPKGPPLGPLGPMQ